MDSVTILRQIRVFQIVTEGSKQKALDYLAEQRAMLVEERKRVEDQNVKMITEFTLKGLDQTQMELFRANLQGSLDKFDSQIAEVDSQVDMINAQVLGEEVEISAFEGPYDLKVGDSIEKATSGIIVVKDGIVVEIRD